MDESFDGSYEAESSMKELQINEAVCSNSMGVQAYNEDAELRKSAKTVLSNSGIANKGGWKLVFLQMLCFRDRNETRCRQRES